MSTMRATAAYECGPELDAALKSGEDGLQFRGVGRAANLAVALVEEHDSAQPNMHRSDQLLEPGAWWLRKQCKQLLAGGRKDSARGRVCNAVRVRELGDHRCSVLVCDHDVDVPVWF